MRPYAFRPVVRARYQPTVPAFTAMPFRPVFRTQAEADNRPAANISEVENGYQIELAIPGIPKDQIQIEAREGQLLVSATNVNQETKENVKYVRKEFNYAGFKRLFTLQKNADTDHLTASFNQGVLTIVVPDKMQVVKKIEIQ